MPRYFRVVYHQKWPRTHDLRQTTFSQVIMRGESMRNGKIADTNYVWLSPKVSKNALWEAFLDTLRL